MPPRTTRLTQLLHDLESELAAAGAPFSSHANAGIRDDEVDDLLATAGLHVPTELREWWRWHDGCRVDLRRPFAQEIGPGSWSPMSLAEALADRASWLESATGEADYWAETWLPFAYGSPDHRRLVGRLDESTADELCVGLWFVFDVPPREPVECSLADVVTVWLRALRERRATWDGHGWKQPAHLPDLPLYTWF